MLHCSPEGGSRDTTMPAPLPNCTVSRIADLRCRTSRERASETHSHIFLSFFFLCPHPETAIVSFVQCFKSLMALYKFPIRIITSREMTHPKTSLKTHTIQSIQSRIQGVNTIQSIQSRIQGVINVNLDLTENVFWLTGFSYFSSVAVGTDDGDASVSAARRQQWQWRRRRKGCWLGGDPGCHRCTCTSEAGRPAAALC